MANTSLDIRQSQTRTLQDQINAASTTQMDSTLASINNELTPPGRLIAASTPSLVVTVGSGSVVNPNTSKNRVLPFVNNTPVSFTGGTITFPSTSGTITVSPGTNATITIGANQYVAVLVQLNTAGQLNLVVGTAAGSLGAVVIPSGSTSSLSLGYIIVQSNGSSVIQSITNAMLYQFVGGGGSGSGSGSGTGDDLDALQYQSDVTELFSSSPTAAASTSTVDTTQTNATYSAVSSYMTLSYDASKTVTGTGTAMTLSGTPAYTVAVGDILRVGTQARKITVVTTQTSYTIEAAFSTNPTGAAACVSQAVYSKDLNSFAFNGVAISAIYTGTLSDCLVIYNDTASGTLYNYTDPALVAYTASGDGSTYTTVQVRESNPSVSAPVTSLATTGSNMYLRFFSNASSSSGTVNLVGYKAFFHRLSQTESGGIQSQAICFTNSVGTPVGCSNPTIVNGVTQIVLSNAYPVGVNSGSANGSLRVYLNGQKIPRFINSTLTPDASYTEINATTIQLDRNYSSQNYSVEVYQDVAVVDSNTQNTTNIVKLQNQLSYSNGLKNYLAAYTASTASGAANAGNGNFENGNTSGWSLAHSTLSSLTPTSVATAGNAFSSTSGGTAASGNLSLSTVQSGQLAGAYSGSLASSAASTAGDMLISSAFNIDVEDKAKVMTIKMYYQVASGSANLNLSGTSSNSFAVWIYDVTNGAWIQPAGVYNFVQNNGTGYLTGSFQTTSNSTQYQIAIVNINASAGAYTFYLDDIFVGPQTAPSGPAMADPVSYTPTLVGFGTVTNLVAYYSRQGKYLEAYISFTTGTTTATIGQIGLPFTIDTSSLSTSLNSVIGEIAYGASTATSYVPLAPSTNQAYFNFGIQNAGTAGIIPTNASNMSSGTSVSFHVRVPIVGWSSNTSMSSDTDTRVVSFVGAIGAQTIGSTAYVQLTNLSSVYDTHGGFGSNTYTVPVSGYYQVNTMCLFNTQASSARFEVALYSNGSLLFNGQQTVGSSSFDTTSALNTVYYFPAGTTLTLYVNETVATNVLSGGTWTVNRLCGPAVVAATESVNARYQFVGATGLPTATPETLTSTYATYTKIRDSHSEFSTTAGTYTIPVSGMYRASMRLSLTPTSANTGLLQASIAQSGSASTTSSADTPFGTTQVTSVSVSDTFYCLAGDVLTFSATQNNGATIALNASTSFNSISIERVGN